MYEVELPQEVRNLLDNLSVAVSFGVKGLSRTPLACAGLSGYVPRLLFWIAAPLLVACCVPLSVAALRWRRLGCAALYVVPAPALFVAAHAAAPDLDHPSSTPGGGIEQCQAKAQDANAE